MNLSNLKNKIQSNKGATIVFALVALIVCVMISAVVVYTAYSNAGRVKNTQNEEQNYLSVSSAVMLLRDSLAGDSATIVEIYEKITKETYDADWETVINTDIFEKTVFTDLNGKTYEEGADYYNDVGPANAMLKDVFNSWANAIVDPPVSQTTLAITITGDSNLSKIEPVEADMVFDPGNMKITATFNVKDASSSADKYSTVMTMDLSKAASYPVTLSSEKKENIDGSNVKTITVTKKVVHTISWDNGFITKEK
ncbi:MAG: hypothetical protein ACOX75_03905 [Lachnospiraceae bacterium]|jgi:hypothetical protein